MNVSKNDIIDFLLKLGYEILLRVDGAHRATNSGFNSRIYWKQYDDEDFHRASVQPEPFIYRQDTIKNVDGRFVRDVPSSPNQ